MEQTLFSHLPDSSSPSKLDFAVNAKPQTLAQWLHYCEKIHPTNIELGLQRVQSVANQLNLKIACPLITVAGTNGKGSTCAMLEAIYHQAGYRCGVYTSPHFVNFEERCRINSEIVQADHLVEHFAAVEQARHEAGHANKPISLTYYEFTTLAIARLLSQSNLDVIVMEVGLGGRLDATNIFDTDCAVITSIDIDHAEFLGTSRESIGYEKAGIMRSQKPAIVSDPLAPQSISQYANSISSDLWLLGRDFNYSGNRQQWSWAGRGKRFAGLAYPALRGANQLLNASGVLATLQALRNQLPVPAQAIRQGLALVEVPGRFQIIPGQPILVLDVAHNPHSVAALTANLDAMGFFPTTHAVFGAMSDKDINSIFKKIGPLIDHWYFTDLPLERAEKGASLKQRWQALQMLAAYPRNTPSQSFQDVKKALQAAAQQAAPTDRIVVFGSFHTVGAVLEHGFPC